VIDPKVLEQLKAAGIDPESVSSQWIETPSVDLGSLPTMQRQRELLLKLREHLRTELEENVSKLGQAHEQLERLKNGGGV
jgi:hypothetical protein